MDFSGNILSRIEDAVINTFFESELMGIKHEQLFKLDRNNFTGSFKKRIVEIINECLEKDKSITLEALKMIESCKGNYEVYMLDIIAQNPLTVKMARDYHSHLGMRRIERKLNVA